MSATAAAIRAPLDLHLALGARLGAFGMRHSVLAIRSSGFGSRQSPIANGSGPLPPPRSRRSVNRLDDGHTAPPLARVAARRGVRLDAVKEILDHALVRRPVRHEPRPPPLLVDERPFRPGPLDPPRESRIRRR